MARPFLAYFLTPAATTAILLSVAATPAAAQPMPPAMPSATPKQEPDLELEKALQLLLQERDQPGPHWISVKTLPPPQHELPRPYVRMYQVLAQLNQAAQARLMLEVAVNKTPNDPEPYLILGDIALQKRRIAEATMDFETAKQLLAKYTSAGRKGALEQQMLSGMARLEESREDWKKAEACLRDLLKLAPKDLDAHERLAHSLFWQGKAKDAYDILKTTKTIDRENAEKNKTKEVFPAPEAIIAQYAEGTDFDRHGFVETWFRAALKKAPDDLLTRQVVANWSLEKGKLDFAKEQADAALQIEASDPKKYSGSTLGRELRGLIALWEKDWRTAEVLFQMAVSENPNDVVARNNLALALVEQDDPAKKQRALAYAKANYREKNSSVEALWTLGWVYFRRGDFDLAELAIEHSAKATNDNVTDADAATYLAHVLYHEDMKWRAKEVLDSVLNADRPFSMRPEAKMLYEKVKDAKKPEAAPAAKSP